MGTTTRYSIGVDLGGTKIAFCLIDIQGTVHQSHQVPTGVSEGEAAVLNRIASGIQTLIDHAETHHLGRVAGIGIGSPGHIDPDKGYVQNAVNLNWAAVPVRDSLKQRLGTELPIYLQKDTNAALLGELYFGAAQGQKDAVLIAAGTGLGVGVISAGQIILGAHHFATDIGHLAVDPQGRLCGCGHRGCIEMYLSGIGVLAGLREHRAAFPHSPLAQREQPTTAELLQAARVGDPLARAVLDEAADWLGLTMMYCGVVLNPGVFILGGGLGLAAAEFLVDRAVQVFRARSLPPIHEGVELRLAQLASNAIGGACLVWHGLGLSSAKAGV